MQRVVISGIGVISPVGLTRETFWSGLTESRAGIGPIQNIAVDRLVCRMAAEVKGFDPLAHFEAKQMSLLDRFAQFAMVAAREALKDSGIVIDEELAFETAAIIGTGIGGQNTIDENLYRLYAENASKAHPFSVPKGMPNAAVSQVSMDLGLKGPAFGVVSACASGSHAIGLAYQMVRNGDVRIALTGGTEACINVGIVKGWEALRVMSPDTCRPFSKDRRGLILGEGAAMLVLESRDNAIARGAPIYAEITGFGMTADAADITSPDPAGAGRAVKAALRVGRLDPSAIDYVNAHGTGTAMNDRTETQVLRNVFGSHADKLAVSSTKGALGHALGGAGALEAAATALAIARQVAPPTINFTTPDPDCALDVIPNVAREMKIEHAISNSFAFGGLNAVLAFSRV